MVVSRERVITCPTLFHFFMWPVCHFLKSERQGTHAYLTWLAFSRPVTHRISIKLQLTGKSRLISHLMHIANIFVSPLAWPLTLKRSLRFALFERIAVQTDWVSVWTARAIRSKKSCYPFERLGLSVRKNVICLNGSSYLLEIIVIRSNGLGETVDC